MSYHDPVAEERLSSRSFFSDGPLHSDGLGMPISLYEWK